jgi:hypothetical protein
MSRRHSNLGSGPPRGPGHYSEDGRRWWENGHRRWFPVTDQEDELEIEVEDIGATSLPARLWTTLVTQYGTRYYRFVGQARSADARWPTYRAIGASFPATGLEDPSGKGAWATEQRGRLEELHQQLLRGGMAPRRAWQPLVVAALPAAGGGADRCRAGRGWGQGRRLTEPTMGVRSPGRPHPRSRSRPCLPRDQPTRQMAARGRAAPWDTTAQRRSASGPARSSTASYCSWVIMTSM